MIEFLTSGITGASIGQMVIYTLIVTHITIVAVTVYLHRCQAHRALDVHPALAHFFRAWLWLTTGMSTRAWASIHRKHHAKCETPDDPHSPQTRGLKTVFWQGAELYRAEAKNPETLARYSHGTPNDWLERQVYERFPWQGVGFTLVLSVILFGFPGVSIWAIQMLWIPVLAAGVINGIGHYWGYRNFDCPDASRNIFPWGILIGGEELHNNHHTHATSAKLSNKWYEFDIGWVYIRIFSFLGLAKVKKVAESPKFSSENKPVLSLVTVQAVVNHRYDVMARYASSMRKAFRSEVAALKLKASNAQERKVLAKGTKLLSMDEAKLCDVQRAELAQLCAQSKMINTLVEMRAELRQIWERTNLSREQMLVQLQAWCERAEQSGIRWLEDMSIRIRRYAA
ncbi:MAG: fatty acid desaturase [Burkholderiales bacterium]|jgi:stearoyl-CoA desaturase (delta-9 desaturase)|uniref:DesA family fatty acid desaturase n=1 Tax=Limnobacter sp. TaxID=2003368 RepID=UPI0039BD14D0|nr:fatty acid desaturase [Burkholderiales bacterium]